jgi:thioredoxin reductase (NADPH)
LDNKETVLSILYDVIIIGSGPAGLAAAIYSGRALLKTLIIEKSKAGGQTVTTNEIDNYPGADL